MEVLDFKFAHVAVMPTIIILFISLCSIVGFAQHLSVFTGGSTAFAPSCNVVGIHFGEFPDFSFVGKICYLKTKGFKISSKFKSPFGLILAPF